MLDIAAFLVVQKPQPQWLLMNVKADLNVA